MRLVIPDEMACSNSGDLAPTRHNGSGAGRAGARHKRLDIRWRGIYGKTIMTSQELTSNLRTGTRTRINSGYNYNPLIKMPSAISPEPVSLPKWQRPAKTKHELPWADIAVIDISKFDQPGGKKQLAEELRQAVRKFKSLS